VAATKLVQPLLAGECLLSQMFLHGPGVGLLTHPLAEDFSAFVF
jgi:hypothetical protein